MTEPERYIDPNSGAAPQPGGFATHAAKAEPKVESKSEEQADPPTDPTHDASIEHQAAPQPATPESDDKKSRKRRG